MEEVGNINGIKARVGNDNQGQGVRGLSTPGGGLSPPPGLGERGPSPLSSPGSASYSQGVQRFSTGETLSLLGVFLEISEGTIFIALCINLGPIRRESTAMGTGKVECQEVPSMEGGVGAEAGR